MLAWEFRHNIDPPKSFSFGGVNGVMGAAIDKVGGDEKEVWFSGLVGADDFEEL